MTITKQELEKIKNDLDYDAKEYFLAMSREDQLLVVLSMEGSNSNRLAVVERWQIEFERKNNLYRSQREAKENQADTDEDGVMSITQKMAKVFAKEMSKRFDVWTWARDRILPPIAIAFILGLLYLVFGGKLP